MSGDPRVLDLLEEMLDSGRTPEEVCRNCPELLPRSVSGGEGSARSTTKSEPCSRNPGPTQNPPHFPESRVTRWWRCSAAAGWVWCTWPGTCGLTGPSP